jgi:hypothetical protein
VLDTLLSRARRAQLAAFAADVFAGEAFARRSVFAIECFDWRSRFACHKFCMHMTTMSVQRRSVM